MLKKNKNKISRETYTNNKTQTLVRNNHSNNNNNVGRIANVYCAFGSHDFYSAVSRARRKPVMVYGHRIQIAHEIGHFVTAPRRYRHRCCARVNTLIWGYIFF